MELSDIQTILSSSNIEDWHVIAAGPTFRLHTYQAIEEHAVASNEKSSGVEHGDTAAYRSDVSLTIAWGLRPAYLKPGLREWASSFADRDVTPFCLDTFWMGALVDRVTLCFVDGHRGVLPWPKFNYISAESDEPGVIVPPTATREAVAVARLVHGLAGNDDFEEGFLRRSGIIVNQ